jgi:fermentation-respiration switch protein FrsA (DUF1100 family)
MIPARKEAAVSAHFGLALAIGTVAWLAAGCQGLKLASPPSPSAAGQTPPSARPPADPLARLERSLVFFPSKYPQGDWQPRGLIFEDAWFRSADGTKLHGWYVPHERPRAVVLYCHGNAGNVTGRAGVLRVLHQMGIAVLIFDYRGYGRSDGKPTEEGVLADARAARAWLAKRTGAAEKDVVLLGRSLGGGVAVDLAATDGARGLVLESTFTSIPDVAAVLYPWLPARLLMRTRLDSVNKIGDYRGPLLQSHGDADRTVPYRSGRVLFEAANQPKRFVTIPEGDHNDPQSREYYQALAAFLEGLPRYAAGSPAQPQTYSTDANLRRTPR